MNEYCDGIVLSMATDRSILVLLKSGRKIIAANESGRSLSAGMIVLLEWDGGWSVIGRVE